MSVGDFLLGTLQQAWEKWNLRMFMLLSMTLQIILVFFAPLRKRSSNVMITFTVWLAYLLANWAAVYCIGLISRSLIIQSFTILPAVQADLLALWAPILLLHLGGPDPITAFALEDNALWLRHLLGLLLQVVAVVYVFYQTLPNNHLAVPIILMFVAGIIKFGERTASLYLANLKSFKNSMLRNPQLGLGFFVQIRKSRQRQGTRLDFPAEMFFKKKRQMTLSESFEEKDLTESDAIKHAYDLFDVSKGLVVGLIIGFEERNESRQFFLARTSDDALKVIAIELNFMYEAFFTKVRVIHSYIGCSLRLVAAASIVTALALYWGMKHDGLLGYDVMVTYILLGAAISLESVGLYMLIFSDWTVVNIKNKCGTRGLEHLRACLGMRFLSWRGLENHRPLKSVACLIRSEFEYRALSTSIFSRRWSQTVPAFNLLSYCLKQCPEGIVEEKGAFAKAVGTFVWLWLFVPRMLIRGLKCMVAGFWCLFPIARCIVVLRRQLASFFLLEIGIDDVHDDTKYVSRNPFIKDVWAVIFEELKNKSLTAEDPDTARRICESRGERVLCDGRWESRCTKLMKFVREVEYDQSILLWHIATELCYDTDDAYEKENHLREFCKIISDYMLYLLVMKPEMMSAVARTFFMRYQDTVSAARMLLGLDIVAKSSDGRAKLREACRIILGEGTSDGQVLGKEKYSSKSVLLDAGVLANDLKELKEDMWEVIIKVWVEMLSHGAIHCSPEMHLQSLSKGGELYTFVWLLMNHLGLHGHF